MLAMHPKVQEKAYLEIKNFFANLNEPMILQDVSKLEYIDMIVKETMRLFPAGSVLGRKTSGDVKIGMLPLNFVLFSVS